MRLWRPVGKSELDKIAALEWRGFPPRLREQPIFYPVLTFTYAEKIARDWNSSDASHDYLGFVTEFDIGDEFALRYMPQDAGGREHRELWVPAEDLEDFNHHLSGPIRLVAEYRQGKRIK